MIIINKKITILFLILFIALIFFSSLFVFLVSTQPTKEEKIETLFIKDNPNFDGVILMDKNYALTFRLQTKDGKILWEKPARSEWVTISEKGNIVLMIGKRYEEGYFSLDRVTWKGFSIYDNKGNLIKEVNDTGRISEAKLLPDDNLVLLTYKDLRMIDQYGNEVWKVNSSAERLDVSADGKFIITIRSILSPQGWESIVYDRKGNVLGNFSEKGSHWNMKLSSDGNQLRIVVGENQHIFNIM